MATMESLSERLLLIETIAQQHGQRLQTIAEQQSIQMQSHQSMHEEVRRLHGQTTTGGRKTIDKILLPERYAGEKENGVNFPAS